MAKGRKGGLVQKKLNMILYGESFTGKSTFASQLAYMHNEDGSPMKVLYIDCESGSIDNYLDEMEASGVNLENIYIIYTSSLAEVLEYIDKVKNGEDFYELDDDGNETDIVVIDAEGNPFRADAMVVDGASILHMSVQQGLLEFSKKRARVRADKNGSLGEERLIAIEGSSLEQKDWGTISYKGQNLILALQGSGVHSIVTCREADEKETVQGDDGKFNSVSTGKKIPAGFKNIAYNADTVIRFCRDELDNVIGFVEKDRTGIHPKEALENPQLSDWQPVIDKSKGRKKFVLKNDLSDAAKTEQELYAREVMGRASAPVSKEAMEEEMQGVNSVENGSVADIIAQIKSSIAKLSATEKSAMKKNLVAAGLPTTYTKITDIDVLTKILNIVSGN